MRLLAIITSHSQDPKMTSDLLDYNLQVQELLTSDSPAIAFDVTYRVLDSEGKLEGEVSGHKFLLALASPVFRRGFYGTDFKEKKTESIEMKGTTLQAFKAMIGVIYRQPLNLKNMSVAETFELMNLAERYDLPKLKKKLKHEFETKVLAKDCVVEAANTAMKFQQLEEACQALLNNCAKTLVRELDTAEAVVKFCASAYDTGDEMIVLKLMTIMSNLRSPCSNCHYTPCRTGTAISDFKQVRAGTVVARTRNFNGGSWADMVTGKTVVKSSTADFVIVEQGMGAKREEAKMPTNHNSTLLWLFSCNQ